MLAGACGAVSEAAVSRLKSWVFLASFCQIEVLFDARVRPAAARSIAVSILLEAICSSHASIEIMSVFGFVLPIRCAVQCMRPTGARAMPPMGMNKSCPTRHWVWLRSAETAKLQSRIENIYHTLQFFSLLYISFY
jgi:hypothetical protein